MKDLIDLRQTSRSQAEKLKQDYPGSKTEKPEQKTEG